MSSAAPIQQMLRPQRRVRYLKIIAVFKILQGLLLFCIGISLLFLHSRVRWLDAVSDWVDGELMVVHSRAVLYLLTRLQDVVSGGLLRVTGWVALFFAFVLCTEGIGVYLQQRWAELLMVVATAAFIPFEVRHAWLHPGAVAILILAVNCFIVWFVTCSAARETGGAGRAVGKRGYGPRDPLGAGTRRAQAEAGERGAGLFEGQTNDVAARTDDARDDGAPLRWAA
jgi:uncharacterized membrane protein (DUF2068 family)